MRRIAAALGVLPVDLLPPEDNPSGLNADERKWLDRYRSATPQERDALDRVTEAMLPAQRRRVA